MVAARRRGGRLGSVAWVLRSRSASSGCSRDSAWVLPLSTLALEGSSDRSRGTSGRAARRATPTCRCSRSRCRSSSLAGLPMLGYAVAAGAWLAQHASCAGRRPRVGRARSRAATAAARSGSSARRRWGASGWSPSRSCSSACSASARTGSRPPLLAARSLVHRPASAGQCLRARLLDAGRRGSGAPNEPQGEGLDRRRALSR